MCDDGLALSKVFWEIGSHLSILRLAGLVQRLVQDKWLTRI